MHWKLFWRFQERIYKSSKIETTSPETACQVRGGVFGGWDLLGKNLCHLIEYLKCKIQVGEGNVIIVCDGPQAFFHFCPSLEEHGMTATGPSALQSEDWKVCFRKIREKQMKVFVCRITTYWLFALAIYINIFQKSNNSLGEQVFYY